MMIQSAPAGDARFVCTMVQHNTLCAQFMAAFGNAAFERPEPYELIAYTVGHHDRGREGGQSKAPSWRQGFKAIKTVVRERFVA